MVIQQCCREAGIVTSGSHSGHVSHAGSEGTGPQSAPVAMTGAVAWRLQQQTVPSHGSGGWKSEIRGRRGRVSGESTLPGL